MSLVQKLAGIMQASDPGFVRVNGRMISNVLAIFNRGVFDFFDGVVDFCYGGALFSMQCTSIGAFQVCPRISQI